eukprot:CFRG4526T1
MVTSAFSAALTLAALHIVDACSTCCSTSDPTYQAGVNQAKVQFDASWKYNDYSCSKVEYTYDQVKSVTPTSPDCLEQGFKAGLEQAFDDAEEKCGCSCKQQGIDDANENWAANEKKYGSDCADNDEVFSKTNEKSPSSPECLQSAYNDQVKTLYDDKLASCVDECEGYGKDQGERLGKLFCSVALGASAPPLTIQICNQQEKQACLDELDSYTTCNCESTRENSSNDAYYKTLQQSCNITISPDQPSQ